MVDTAAPERSPPGEISWTRRLGWAALALWGALVLLWVAEIAGGWRMAWPASAVPVLALLAAGAWLAALAAGEWMAGGERRRAAAALAAVVAVALAARFTGIAHEASGHYYLDEGTYYHHATAIAAGRPLSQSFVYPHLTYYADAFALWLAGLFPGVVARLAPWLWRVSEPVDVAWVLLRSVVALFGALSSIPAFALGRRLGGGLAAGAAGGLLLALSPLYNAGSHVNTCDVPAAFFAAVCVALSARLLERESARGYLAAGAAAGLAAGAKYPAGLAAVAIVAVYLACRLRRRDGHDGPADWLGIVWAGLAAVAALLATTPSLLAYPRIALYGQKGIFFGARQYGQGGWIGVVPGSDARFYGDNLVESFGLPVLVAGGIGLVLLFARQRDRRLALLALAPFPIVFWLLITSMSMVVKRNLYPLLPVLAAYLGAGLAAWLALARERTRPALASAAAVLSTCLVWACLAPPAVQTAQDDVGLARPTTREEAAAWIRANLPHGARILKEQYTPELPAADFAVAHIRFAGRLSPEELRASGNDYLLLASDAYQRFLRPELTVKEHQRQIGENYRAILGGWRPIAEWAPSDTRLGPVLKLYRLEPAGEGRPAP